MVGLELVFGIVAKKSQQNITSISHTHTKTASTLHRFIARGEGGNETVPASRFAETRGSDVIGSFKGC